MLRWGLYLGAAGLYRCSGGVFTSRVRPFAPQTKDPTECDCIAIWSHHLVHNLRRRI